MFECVLWCLSVSCGGTGQQWPALVPGNRQPTRPPETPGHSWASLGQSLVGSLLLSPGSWCAQSFVCTLQESISPVLCKFWRLYDGINGKLLQEGLCHTPGCCTQSPCSCRGPFGGGRHYLPYLHHSFGLKTMASGQTTGRGHSPAHQQKIELKIY